MKKTSIFLSLICTYFIAHAQTLQTVKDSLPPTINKLTAYNLNSLQATPPPDLAYGLFEYWGVGLGIYSAASGLNQGIGIWTNLNNIKAEVVRISNSGDVGIGTTDPKGYRLAVNGNIRAKEVKVEHANWPDYVFTKSYSLPTLQETEKHIKEKGHLPGIPSAIEVKVNGIDLGEMNAKLLQKIEELTIYLIESDKKAGEQEGLLKKQNGIINALAVRLEVFEKKFNNKNK